MQIIKKYIFSFWPILFILGVWFIFASPYFLKGKVPFASDYHVNFFPPWSHYEKFWGPVKNNAMPDIHTQIYPWKKFTIDTLKSGNIPFWNPYNFSGNPHLANYQSAVLSPFNVFFFIFPFIDAWSILILLQPLLAGIFMYFLLRVYKVSNIASLLSALSFMFCGFVVVWMAYGTLAMAIIFLPLALLAIEKYIQTSNVRYLILLGFVIPLSFFSGHFQTSIYFFSAVSLYALYKGIFIKEKRKLFFTVFAIISGLFLSATQILSSIELYNSSVRKEIFIQEGGIPFSYLVTLFSPDFYGNPVTRNDWFGFYAEWSSFIGIIPFLFAVVAILVRGKKVIYFFILLAAVALLTTVTSPIQSFIGFLHLPVISTSNPTRIIVLFSFSLAVLAGFGFDNAVKELKKGQIKKIIIPFLLLGGLLIIIWSLLLIGKVLPQEKSLIAQRNLLLPSILFCGAFVTMLFSYFYKKLLFVMLFYLLLAVSFDSFRFVQKWMPFGIRELVFSDVPVIAAISKHIGYGRIFGNIGTEVSTYYKFSSIEGYDPLYIGRYGEFIRSSQTGDLVRGERSVVKIGRDGKYTNRVLDLLGVSIIFHPIPDTNQGWAYPVWKDLERHKLIYSDDKFHLYKNTKSLSRASLFYQFEVIKNDNEIIKRFYSTDFDFRKTVIIEEKVSGLTKEGTGSAKIVLYSPNKIVIEAATDMPALLFLADNFYPGWGATVNGKQVKIYRADYTFRAVAVPSGKSKVEFNYENWHF